MKDIRHPFILTVERYEEIDGKLVIVMELADKDLSDRLVECQHIVPRRILRPCRLRPR